MEIKVNGNVPLKIDEATETSLSSFIEKKFPDLMNISQRVLYISGFMDEDNLDYLSSFFSKIYSVMDTGEERRIKIKSDLSNLIGEYVINEKGISMSMFSEGNENFESRTIFTA